MRRRRGHARRHRRGAADGARGPGSPQRPEAANLPAAGPGGALASLGALHARLTAAHAGLLRRSAACDALAVPVVTGHPDMAVTGQIIEVCLAAAGPADPAAPAGRRPMPPQAHAALRMQAARLAIDFVSGPAGIAGYLRTRLPNAPYSTTSLPLDIGSSASIPAAIRRAVTLRGRHCARPGCAKPPPACDVHHLVHKSDGGKTSVSSCVLLCQFHHDVCIHRRGWQLILHPDGTTEAISPYGEVLRSHGPPTLRAG